MKTYNDKLLSHMIKHKEEMYDNFPYPEHKGLPLITAKSCWNYDKYLDGVLLKS